MDILASAIQLELDSERYYLQQADLLKGSILQGIFTELAAVEATHCKLLMAQAEGQPIDMPADNGKLAEKLALFHHAGVFRDQHEGIHNQLEPYQTAMAMEKKSVELYQSLFKVAETEPARVLFALLIREEQKHYDVVEAIYRHLDRPNEWVEAAEFGIREDY